MTALARVVLLLHKVIPRPGTRRQGRVARRNFVKDMVSETGCQGEGVRERVSRTWCQRQAVRERVSGRGCQGEAVRERVPPEGH
jgi:hypothetical protein